MNKDALEAKELYNKQAKTFATNQSHYAPVQDLKKNIFTYLGNLQGQKVLFIGCADGYECAPAIEQGAHVTGIDISENLIAQAKGKYPQAQFHVMDQQQLSFENESFDLIIAFFSVMYTQNLEALYQEFHRVLKKEGKIAVAVPHPIRKMMKYNGANYFVKGKQYETWKGVARFNYYRLFEDYVDACTAAELLLIKAMEPKPIAESESASKDDLSYPHFLVMVMKRT